VKFDYGASAELFMPKRKGGVRPPLGHRRFARAAEAIALLSRIFPPCTRSERGFRSGDERFNSDEIQSLYARVATIRGSSQAQVAGRAGTVAAIPEGHFGG